MYCNCPFHPSHCFSVFSALCLPPSTLSLENRNCLLPICSSFPVLMTHNTYLEKISLWKTIKMALFNMKQHKPHFDWRERERESIAKKKALGNSPIRKVSVLWAWINLSKTHFKFKHGKTLKILELDRDSKMADSWGSLANQPSLFGDSQVNERCCFKKEMCGT